jgi:hypothetical protein
MIHFLCHGGSHSLTHVLLFSSPYLQKWNTRLFQEMHAAYLAGRASANPADTWYKGELWFFDNYIIPLAHKLRECRVFGASCDELLNYALDNRAEWQAKGEQVVAELVEQAASSCAAGRNGPPCAASALPPMPAEEQDDGPVDHGFDTGSHHIGPARAPEEEEEEDEEAACARRRSSRSAKQDRLFL